MNAIIILDGKEIDPMASVTKTVKALSSGTVFTEDELVSALVAAKPDEEELIQRLAPRVLRRTVSNAMMSDYYCCDEIGNGQYCRK